VHPVAVSGFNFVSTFEAGTYKLSGSEEYMKIYWGQRDGKMLVILFILQVHYMCGAEHICF
jgi:hypothetical protein